MTAMANYTHGFGKRGVSIRDMPVLNTYSRGVLWVDSGGAQNSDGSFSRPYSAIDTAINKANARDVIMVKAGHAETVAAAAGIDADVQGISIIGLGSGTDMPEVTIATATTADIDIDAANITIKGIRFLCAIASMAAGIDVNSTDFTLEDCEFHESSATGLTWVDVNGGAANACDRAKIRGNRFYCATAANWDRAIELGEVADGVEITDNIVIGDFDDAGIHNPTGKVLTNLLIADNYVRNNQAGQHAIELVSACTGVSYGNTLVTDAQATAYDAGALSCAGTDMWQVTTGGDSAGVPVFAATDSTTNFIGVDDADNLASTSNVAANEDGSVLERLEQVQEAVNKGTGTALAANKSLVDVLGSDGTTVTDAAVSVLGAIGADNANNAFASTNVVANVDGSVLERLEHVQRIGGTEAMNRNAPNYLSVTADFTSATWNTIATHEVFTVTGTVRMKVLIEASGNGAGATATAQLGYEGATSNWIGVTTITDFVTGELWYDTSPTTFSDTTSTAALDKIVSGGKDVGYEIVTAAATGGGLIFHCWWEPISSDGAVVAGAGGTL